MSDARWSDPRGYDARDRDAWPRVYDPRDRDDDPRDALMRDLDLPRGDERELAVDRDRVYELDGEDSRTLAAVGAFRVVPEHDLDLPQDTLENLHDQRVIELVDLGDGQRGLTLTAEARDLLDSHSHWLPETNRRDVDLLDAPESASRRIPTASNDQKEGLDEPADSLVSADFAKDLSGKPKFHELEPAGALVPGH